MSSNRASNDRLLQLIAKFKAGTASKDEIEEVNQWYDSFSTDETYSDGLGAAEWEAVGQRLFQQTQWRMKRRPAAVHPVWTYVSIAAAAAAVILVFFGIRLFNVSSQSDDVALEAILPGGNKAIIQLSDGRILDLSTEQEGVVMSATGIRYLDGTSLLDNAQMQTGQAIISTPPGGQYQLTLPDGTSVWLNASSSLEYPVSFTGSAERKVQLDGEAYFEVNRQDNVPFKVVTRYQAVEVLGTHFSVNSYADEPEVKTTLIEGRVRVQTLVDNRNGTSVILKPGEQSAVIDDKLAVYDVDTQSAIDWTTGEFIFRNESLESIMRRIARWYNVAIAYPKGIPSNEYFKGRISRFDDVQTVLEMLAETGDVQFQIRGRSISVTPSNK